MQPTLSGFSHVLLTFHHHLHLRRHLAQPSQYLLVALDKAENFILNLSILTKLSHQHLQSSQVVPGNTREEVMHGLEL